ncbi:YciI family protein [Sphingomonas mali]|uniref:YciI family protein n=1 Tax=Sphingomonas mali TaxID=40682 RepID=UPI00082AD557|nr:YciI family protein [Sphingomonas mali]
MPATHADAPVCLILITYVVPLDEVDRHMKSHIDWLERGYDEGLFLLSGRRNPRTGGVIVCRGHRAEVEALAASDPFVTSGAATIEVIEFNASWAADAVVPLLA